VVLIIVILKSLILLKRVVMLGFLTSKKNGPIRGRLNILNLYLIRMQMLD
jgi:hypothetical protein